VYACLNFYSDMERLTLFLVFLKNMTANQDALGEKVSITLLNIFGDLRFNTSNIDRSGLEPVHTI